ncbi:MAG TPA: M24 family metallopeptidase [Candidatus Bathyarchaeia archaeon]|nr:M24 family metallopeptidase [Candidatus Bathyarchaeia archaeon]
MKLDKTPLRMDFLRKKLRFVRQTMEQQQIDMWITFSRGGNEDPMVHDLRSADLTWRSAAIIGQDGSKTAIVGNLDVEAVEQSRFYDEVYGYGSEGAVPKLRQHVRRKRPGKIAVNTSYDEGAADGLTSGMAQYLKKALGSYSKRLVSAEDLAIALRSRLIPEEVRLIKKAIRECEKIYDKVQDYIKPGRKDKDVHDYAHKLLRERALETAWAFERCPSVNVGNNVAGHIGYRGTRIRNGDFVKLDFGVRYEGYCSDSPRSQRNMQNPMEDWTRS